MKRKTVLLSTVLLMTALLGSGCANAILYIAVQTSTDDTRYAGKVRDAAQWPVGNVTRLNLEHLEDAWSKPDDYLLPPVLDRTLNSIVLMIDVPFSIIFDVLSLPWQWWRYYHLPALSEKEKSEELKRANAAVLNTEIPTEIRRNEPFEVKVSFAGKLEGKNLIYQRNGQNFKVVFTSPHAHSYEAVPLLNGKPLAAEKVTAGKVYVEKFRVDAPELYDGRRYLVKVKFIPDEAIDNLHDSHKPRWVQVTLIDPKK